MPNWCRNNLTINSKDKVLIDKFNESLRSEGFFQFFIPNPAGNWEYSWSVENWGTKWDIRGDEIQIIQDDDDRIIVDFDTAWGPPIQFYSKLEELGYEVHAMYDEPGMEFCGIYSDGKDLYFEYGDMDSSTIRETIPIELDECFMLSELAEEREQEELDN